MGRTRTKTAAEPAVAPVAAAVGATMKMIKARQLVPRDDNLREDLSLDDEFKKSIAELGVLVPLMVEQIVSAPGVTVIEDGYWIDAGHRRREAAILAFGLDVELPCIIQSQLSDVQRTELMLIENLRRKDLNPVEEARGFARLVELGMNKKDLAKAVGYPESTVTDRMKLLALPHGFLVKVSAGELSLEHAKELLKLNVLPHPEAAMKKATKNGTYQLHSNVNGQLQAHKRAQKLDGMTAELQAKGWAVARTNSYVSPGKTINGKAADGKRCQLTPLKHIGLEAEAGKHGRERCKAKILEYEIYSDRVKETPACSDPTRHTGIQLVGEEKPIAPTSKLVAPPKEVLEEINSRTTYGRSTLTPEQAAEKLAREEQLEAAEKHHDDFLRSLVQGKAVTRADRIDMLVELLSGMYVAREAESVAGLLGIEAVMVPERRWTGGEYTMVDTPRFGQPLQDYMAASKTNRERAVWAWTLVKEAGNFKAGEMSAFRDWMEELGFERHPFDEQVRRETIEAKAKQAEQINRLPSELQDRLCKLLDAAARFGYAPDEYQDDVDQAFADNPDDEALVASVTAMLEMWEADLGLEDDASTSTRDVETVADPNSLLSDPQVRTCRGCGCTDEHACEGGCSWVESDLCSACAEKGDTDRKESAVGVYAGDEDNGDEITSGPDDDQHEGDVEPYDDDARYEGSGPAEFDS